MTLTVPVKIPKQSLYWRYLGQETHLSINTLLVCLSVCLFVNAKTAEPIVILGKVYGWSNFQKFASIKIRFLNILKIHEIFGENSRIIFVLFYDVHKENMFTINLEDGPDVPTKASLYINLSCLSVCLSWCLFVCIQ